MRLPAGSDEAAIVGAAGERGIAMEGLARFGGGGGEPALVLGYANLPEPAIARGLAELADALC